MTPPTTQRRLQLQQQQQQQEQEQPSACHFPLHNICSRQQNRRQKTSSTWL